MCYLNDHQPDILKQVAAKFDPKGEYIQQYIKTLERKQNEPEYLISYIQQSQQKQQQPQQNPQQPQQNPQQSQENPQQQHQPQENTKLPNNTVVVTSSPITTVVTSKP